MRTVMTHRWRYKGESLARALRLERPPRGGEVAEPLANQTVAPAGQAGEGAKERRNGNPVLPFAPRCTNSQLLPTRYAVCVSALRAWARGSTPPVASPPAEVVAALRAEGLEGLCIDRTNATSSSPSQGRRPFTTPAGSEGPGFGAPRAQGRRPDTGVLRSSAGIAVILRIPVLVRARR